MKQSVLMCSLVLIAGGVGVPALSDTVILKPSVAATPIEIPGQGGVSATPIEIPGTGSVSATPIEIPGTGGVSATPIEIPGQSTTIETTQEDN